MLAVSDSSVARRMVRAAIVSQNPGSLLSSESWDPRREEVRQSVLYVDVHGAFLRQLTLQAEAMTNLREAASESHAVVEGLVSQLGSRRRQLLGASESQFRTAIQNIRSQADRAIQSLTETGRRLEAQLATVASGVSETRAGVRNAQERATAAINRLQAAELRTEAAQIETRVARLEEIAQEVQSTVAAAHQDIATVRNATSRDAAIRSVTTLRLSVDRAASLVDSPLPQRPAQ